MCFIHWNFSWQHTVHRPWLCWWHCSVHSLPIEMVRNPHELRLSRSDNGLTHTHRGWRLKSRIPVMDYQSPQFRSLGTLSDGPGLAGTGMSPFWILLELRMMKVVSGDNWSYKTFRAPVKMSPPKNRHPVFFTGRMPFLSPNQQCESTEGKWSYQVFSHGKTILWFKKNMPTLADYNYDPVQSILIIFSKLFVNDHKSCLVVKFSTSPHMLPLYLVKHNALFCTNYTAYHKKCANFGSP